MSSISAMPSSQLSKEEIQFQIDQNFNKATYAEYVHYVLKNCASKTTYEKHFQSKVEEISQKTSKPVSLDSKRVNLWTPLHVGAIMNNIEGVRYLLSLGIPSEKDAFGKTPYDYCILFAHQDLAQILKKSSKMASQLDSIHNIVHTLLKTWGVNLLNIPFEYKANTHDFGVEIVKLLFSRASKSVESGLEIRHIAHDMQQTAKIEGFDLTFTHSDFFPRDHFIMQSDHFKLPSYSEHVMKAIERKSSYELIHASPTDYACMSIRTTGGGVECEPNTVFEFISQFGRNPNKLPFYLEGGNHFILSNFKGTKKVLMGADVLLIALNELLLKNFFKEPLKYVQRFIENLSENDIENTLKEMYAQGLLKQSESCPKGLISLGERLTTLEFRTVASHHGKEFNEKSYLNQAIAFGYFKPLKLTSKTIADCRKLVARYLARKEMTKDFIAECFSIPTTDLHFIPQLDYHLNVFIHSGPCGSLFVQDYEMVKNLLEAIKKDSAFLKMTSNDLRMLEQYYSIACKLARQYKPMHTEAIKELKKADFTVIPTPGIFYDVCPPCFFDNASFG